MSWLRVTLLTLLSLLVLVGATVAWVRSRLAEAGPVFDRLDSLQSTIEKKIEAARRRDQDAYEEAKNAARALEENTRRNLEEKKQALAAELKGEKFDPPFGRTLARLLKAGIGLRGYAQRDPKNEYKAEGFKLFEKLIANLDRERLGRLIANVIVQHDTARPCRDRHPAGALRQRLQRPGYRGGSPGVGQACPGPAAQVSFS